MCRFSLHAVGGYHRQQTALPKVLICNFIRISSVMAAMTGKKFGCTPKARFRVYITSVATRSVT